MESVPKPPAKTLEIKAATPKAGPLTSPKPAAPAPPIIVAPAPPPAPISASHANGDFRSVLLAKKEEVMAGMGMKFDAASKMGRVAEDDAVQIAHDEFINLRLNAIGWDQLRLLDEALDRLQTGEFGVCMRCEEPIPPKRLAVVPWAKYCVRCQERISAREHLREETPAHQAAW
ncbi:MAG: TraR/DksA family transcriptional regulator [Bryobacterales bacterium]|nr:TraR/DksA family transcriptional regulator [Bryobacterales bacterium]